MVRTDELPVALLGFVAFVVMIPIWVKYFSTFNAARPEDLFLGALILPAMMALFIISWVKPEFSGVVLGGFMLVAVLLLAPWWFRFIDMASGALTESPLARTLIQIAVPMLILSFLYSLGKRRLVNNG